MIERSYERTSALDNCIPDVGLRNRRFCAHAAPPVTSAYFTDPQSSYVQDATSDSIGQVNMISCIMHSMRPDALVKY